MRWWAETGAARTDRTPWGSAAVWLEMPRASVEASGKRAAVWAERRRGLAEAPVTARSFSWAERRSAEEGRLAEAKAVEAATTQRETAVGPDLETVSGAASEMPWPAA
jgi:hypothetical protein